MSDAPIDGAYAAYLERMLVHEPELRLARAVVPSQREPRAEAVQVLDALLLDAALDVRDAGVALAKLGWWHDEIARMRAGEARHPVAARLAALGAVDPVELEARVNAAGAIAQLDSPADEDALRAPFIRYARSSARPGGTDREVEALAAAHLAMRLRRWPSFAHAPRARIPLAVLARVGSSREAAATDPVVVGAVIEALARPLAILLEAAVAHPDARVTTARHLLRALRRDPRRAVEGGARARPLPLLWALWRSARRERAA